MSVSGAKPTVVLFDLDDTLFAHSAAVRAGVAAHRASHGGAMAAADHEAEFARWTALEEHHYHRYLQGEVPYLDMRRARARAFVEPFGLDLSDDGAADDWFARYVREYRQNWALFDDTLPCLDALALAQVRLGIVTNAELEFQLGKLDTLGITQRFEHVIASAEVGAAKPDARIFAFAASAFDVSPAECVFVGDRLHTDAIGASDAGMRGVWLDRSGSLATDRHEEALLGRVDVIHSLADLPQLVVA